MESVRNFLTLNWCIPLNQNAQLTPPIDVDTVWRRSILEYSTTHMYCLFLWCSEIQIWQWQARIYKYWQLCFKDWFWWCVRRSKVNCWLYTIWVFQDFRFMKSCTVRCRAQFWLSSWKGSSLLVIYACGFDLDLGHAAHISSSGMWWRLRYWRFNLFLWCSGHQPWVRSLKQQEFRDSELLRKHDETWEMHQRQGMLRLHSGQWDDNQGSYG